jgi:hypothetical protein
MQRPLVPECGEGGKRAAVERRGERVWSRAVGDEDDDGG